MGGRGSGRKRLEEPTTYTEAWKVYTRSQAYTRVHDHLKLLGMCQPYIDNLIRTVFDEGWHRAVQVHCRTVTH